MRVLETTYKGYRFRSRLEARWAVFLDTLGIPYQYETEGYELGNGLFYLPDFYLPYQNCFVEIKGIPPNEEEEAKASGLAQDLGRPIYIFWGEVPDTQGKHHADSAYKYDVSGRKTVGYKWCECPECGCKDIQQRGRINLSKMHESSCSMVYRTTDGGCSPNLAKAYGFARSARFESKTRKRITRRRKKK